MNREFDLLHFGIGRSIDGINAILGVLEFTSGTCRGRLGYCMSIL